MMERSPPAVVPQSVTQPSSRGAIAKHPHTRSQARNLLAESSQPSLIEISMHSENEPELPSTHTQTQDSIQNTGEHQTNNNQQNIDYTQINQMIENTVSRVLRNLNLVPNPVQYSEIQSQTQGSQIPLEPTLDLPTQYQPNIQPNLDNRNSRPFLAMPSNNHQSPSPNTNFDSSFRESFTLRSDRITSIIQNWNIKFDGSIQGISVDEFLYRVGVLTREHFNNDFSLICKNLHVLLSGRAREWYWRYHKQVETLTWKEFCEALKYQYKDFKSSFDIYEELRNRKMKPNESFEMFYDSISKILDRLEKPIPEAELVEILTRNLRPEIRHELLYIPIYSIAHLRKLVQMRENLFGDEYFRKNSSVKTTPYMGLKKQVAEVNYTEDKKILELSPTTESSINAIQHSVKCWNCDQFGHYWEDCLEERKVFCYGCGEKNTYKPQCAKCSSKRLLSKNFQSAHHPQKLL